MKNGWDIIIFVIAFLIFSFFISFWVPYGWAAEIEFSWKWPVSGDPDYICQNDKPSHCKAGWFEIHRDETRDKKGAIVVSPMIPIESRHVNLDTPEDDICYTYWITSNNDHDKSDPSNMVVVCNKDDRILLVQIMERK